MGKKSTKADKNIYQISRENMELTRESASELLEFVSATRIEKIESEKSLPHPDEVLVMADKYKTPNLCNYFCSHDCPIGINYVPEINMKDLSQITLEILASLNSMEKKKDRLVEIVADGVISDNELEDFAKIQNELEHISVAVESLQLWVEKTIQENEINIDKLEKARAKIN